MFKIEVLPAGHGDCIYIEYGDSEAPSRVLIDGGPYYGFKHLADRINEISASIMDLELLVVTHVDCDHIDGIVKLLGAQPSGLTIHDVWFNAWRHLSQQPEDMLGPVQGEMLSALIEKRHLPWNATMSGRPVSIPNSESLKEIILPGGLKITLLSPTTTELTELIPFWEEEVREAGLEPDSRERALELLLDNIRLKPPGDLLGAKTPNIEKLLKEDFEMDESRANASSIAFLAEYEGKKCLFTGDAHPDVLVDSLNTLLAQCGESCLQVEALKLSHHGSKGNTSPELLKLLDCKRFIVSTNGNYFKHPDPETIARIIVESGPHVELFFNYRSDETKVWDNEFLQNQYFYKTHYPEQIEDGLTIQL